MLWSGILFAVLLCMKHIYLYLAPAYFVFLLRAYCLSRKSVWGIRFRNVFKLGSSILAIFGLALGPFVYWGQSEQLLRRLFPFSRGLCHAYWAPNFWALYSFTDRVLLLGMLFRVPSFSTTNLTHLVAPRLGLHVNEAAVESTSRGLVGDTSFAVLPEVAARTTFTLTLLAQLVSKLLASRWLIRLTREAVPAQSVLPTHLGSIRGCGDPLRIRFVSFRVACA